MIGRVLYGALFVGLLPGAIVLWERATRPLLPGPGLLLPELGAVLIVVGTALILGGWHALWFHGGGLPMNAFPPPRLATRGAFALVAHPIYIGFDLGLFGVALVTGSASLFWLIAPLVTLGSLALLYGYELHGLSARFGLERARPLLSLPPRDGAPTFGARASIYFVFLFPWAVLYESVTRLGPPVGPIETYLPFEHRVPLVTALYPAYASVYVAAMALPLLLPSSLALRRYAISGIALCAVTFPLHWFLPFVATPRPLEPGSPFASAIELERALDSARCALPSFHAIYACLVAGAASETWPRLRIAMWAWAALVGAACIGVGMHGIVDVVAGGIVGVMAWRYDTVWRALRGATERLANSWTEWSFGRVRVIVHGIYAALATAVGIVLVVSIAGPASLAAAVMSAFAGLLGAALWAQWVEGSPSLLRPYGFYGGVIGIVGAALAAPLLGGSTWALLGAYAVAGPWVQALGRLRCLVQGCCHGAPTTHDVGVRYRHPRSRVVRLSPWAGEPIHATPLYSILGNGLAALILWRAWVVGMPASFVAGLFLVLNGLARFVEESYRGEEQTPVARGLRLYQWIALACIVGGAALTAFPTDVRGAPFAIAWWALAPAVVVGVIVGAALGVDFPRSNARFSRLA